MSVFGITLVVIGVCVSLYLNAREIKSSADLVTHLRSQVDQRQQEFERVKKDANRAQTSLNQETIIRDELLMQKQGEYIVQMPDLPQPIISQKVTQKQLSPWQEWKRQLELP